MQSSTTTATSGWFSVLRGLGTVLIAAGLLFAAGCDSNDSGMGNGNGNGDDDGDDETVTVDNPNYDTTDAGQIVVSDAAEGRGISYLDADSNLVEDVTWSNDFVYQLDNFVFVDEGETLTIEPGTVIQGLPGSGADAAAMIVTRGGTIQADGERDDGTVDPIIFTAEGDDGGGLGRDVKGRWGGVILLGDAPINSQPPTTQIEGIPDEVGGDRIRYGAENGDFDPDHNVGTFRYVSIRHTGTALQGGDEIQGLTLGGVGSGSTVEYVESYASDDDGFEWFGGTVNTKYLIAAYASDDSYDIDEGWTGSNQFWLAVQNDGEAGRIGEHDGGTDPEDGTPLATSVVSNATYIGIGPGVTENEVSGDRNNPFLMQRDNNATSYYNTIFMGGRENAGLQIEDLGSGADARERYLAGDLVHQDNLWFNVGPDFGEQTTFEDLIQIPRDSTGAPTGDGGEDWIDELAQGLRDGGNQVLNPDQTPIASITRNEGGRGPDGPVQSFDPAPAGPATSGANAPDSFGDTGGVNAEWTQVPFRGAFGSGAEWALDSQWALITQDGTVQQ